MELLGLVLTAVCRESWTIIGDPMLTAQQVQCALEDWRNGYKPQKGECTKFEEKVYLDDYKKHMETMRELQNGNGEAYKRIMDTLYLEALYAYVLLLRFIRN
jgi:hypothetical protein